MMNLMNSYLNRTNVLTFIVIGVFSVWVWNDIRAESEIQVLKDRIAEIEGAESIPPSEKDDSSVNINQESVTIAKPTTSLDSVSSQAKQQRPLNQVNTATERIADSIQDDVDVQIMGASVQESILEDGSGVFLLGLLVSSPEKDIYIPQTTTDSTNGYTAFSYTVDGDDFRGVKSSKIDCTLRQAGQCKIKAGQTKEIFVTVWLYPDLPGDYAVRFMDFGYRYDLEGSLRKLPINKSTETLYLNYI